MIDLSIIAAPNGHLCRPLPCSRQYRMAALPQIKRLQATES
jgi:hypothetical protein